MFRLNRETDYGIVLLSCIAREPGASFSAAQLAERGGLPQPTVSKVLKLLARAGLLVSSRGARGGYSLARPAAAISVADIVTALDGPIALTECSPDGHGACSYLSHCHLNGHWAAINQAIRAALEGVTLADLGHPIPATAAAPVPRSYARTPS